MMGMQYALVFPLAAMVVWNCFLPTSAFSPAPINPYRKNLPLQMMEATAVLEGTIPSLLADLGDSYSYCLDNHFFPTQCATGGVFASLGDVLAQSQDASTKNDKQSPDATSTSNNKQPVPVKQQYDPRRTMVYFFKGMGGGILWSCWFGIADTWSLDLTAKVLPNLDYDFELLEPSTMMMIQRATRTAICIGLEQFLVCPLFYTFWDIPIPALLRGSPMRQIPAQVQHKLGPLLVANAKVWTPVNLITYNIPVELRVLFTSVTDIAWQSILATITSQEIRVGTGSVAEDPPLLQQHKKLARSSTASSTTTTAVAEEQPV
jgi:protein Mpv17